MSIHTGSILFLTRDFTSLDSVVVDEQIQSVCNEVVDSRKGRHWEACVTEPCIGLTVHVSRTDQCLYECENELLDHNLLPEDVPECITIITNLGTENDLKICEFLTHTICEELGCLSSGAKYFS